MAGYSGTPLPRKLGIAEGSRVALIGAPDDLMESLGELPPDVRFLSGRATNLDVIVFFVTDRRSLQTRFDALARRLRPTGGLWIAWPKKTSGVDTDLSQTVVMDIGLSGGAMVDNKVAAVDEVWSGLRFVVRKTHRDGWPD